MTPALKAEVEAQYPALVAALTPATDMQLLKVLTREAPGLGIPGRDREEWGALFAEYLKRLADLPLEAIEAAFDGWHHGKLYPKDVGRHVFFPKDVEIRALAEPYMTNMRKAQARAKKVLEFKPHREWTDAQRKASLAEAKAMGLLDRDDSGRLKPIIRPMPTADDGDIVI